MNKKRAEDLERKTQVHLPFSEFITEEEKLHYLTMNSQDKQDVLDRAYIQMLETHREYLKRIEQGESLVSILNKNRVILLNQKKPLKELEEKKVYGNGENSSGVVFLRDYRKYPLTKFEKYFIKQTSSGFIE